MGNGGMLCLGGRMRSKGSIGMGMGDLNRMECVSERRNVI